MLPKMPENAGGLSLLKFVTDPETKLTDHEKLELLGAWVLFLDDRLHALENIAGYGKGVK